MKRSSYTLPAIVRSRGVGLITAIFLLVVIAGLAVAMVTVYTTQQTSSALDLQGAGVAVTGDVQGARAYQAARAGLEWGIFHKVRGDSCVGVSSFAFDNDTSLRGFVVTVTCEGPSNDGVDALAHWKVTATACNIPVNNACSNPVNSIDYVQRVMEVTF